MTKRHPVTIAEIARRAGVNKSTVSRALTPGQAGVSASTVARITTIAAELGYLPDPAAASLRTGRTGVIGVLVPHMTDYVLASIYEGVAHIARHHGYVTMGVTTEDDPALRVEQLESMLKRRVDGVVVGDARLDGDEVVATVRRQGLPYILVNRRLHGHPSITADDELGGRLAAEHLLGLGHTEVAVLAGPGYTSTGVERAQGFATVYRKAGIGIDSHLVVSTSNSAEAGYEAAKKLLSDRPALTGIFVTNDFAAIGAMGAAREAGRLPGSDLSVVGYNDIPLAQHLSIPLTSIKSDLTGMGTQAAEALISQLRGESQEIPSVLLQPHLSIRQSTSARIPLEAPHLGTSSHSG